MNKTKLQLLITSLICLLLASCEKSFISDKDYAQQVEADYQAKVKQLPKGELFNALDTLEMTDYEREAMKFLYAYMPMADITDQSTEFYLRNLRTSEEAKAEMPWGEDVPELFYRHFVLPIRVNNEHLDSARMVFYSELKDRVKDLSMKDAVLEVNHWCHEKAIYTPSDARTSSPLATVKTAYGRCGEESTLLVAALRSVGIPARQVYTPRWAHTDDNHAWVEAWADGKWYFLGACEPEPVLDLAWFNAPASRGMLMHTKVFGRYNGKEEVMSQTPTYTEINVIENYAPTATAKVRVLDEAGKPVVGALVEFKLYNYAEFYSIARKITDNDGFCSLTAGRGDVLAWASKDGKFGFHKLSFAKDKELSITLDKDDNSTFDLELDVVPPSESANMPEVSKEAREENNRRLAEEDSIRNAYVSTFVTEDKAKQEAFEIIKECCKITHNLSSGGKSVWKEESVNEQDYAESISKLSNILIASRGNYKAVKEFILQSTEKGFLGFGLSTLEDLTDKDLRDFNSDILVNQELYTQMVVGGYNHPSLAKNRIYREELTAYKKFFSENIDKQTCKELSDPNKLIKFCLDSLTLNDSINGRGIYISPEGVWKARLTDKPSRKIFFVAVARSVGLPAWLDPMTNKAQYYFDGEVKNVNFESGLSSQPAKGQVKATFTPTAINDNPKYYNHFTISKLENGRLQLMNFDYGTTTWESLLKKGAELPVGHYVLTTGTRLASGAVLTKLSTFKVEEAKQTTTKLVMRESKDKVQVIGSFNAESLFTDLGSTCDLADGSCRRSILSACGRGYYVIGILDTKQEPTNHALRDIALLKADLEKWGRKMVMLFPNEEEAKKFDSKAYGDLPNTIIYGIDSNGIEEQIRQNMKLKHKELLPIFIIADTFNRVVFVSQGYTIGLGEQIKTTVAGL